MKSIAQNSHCLMKMCLNETYNKVCRAERLSNTFPLQNSLKQGVALLPLLFNFF
jgi:hypothetical protein